MTTPAAARRPTPEAAIRLRLDLAYDGAAFAGWAKQPGLRTVQGELESALRVALRLPAPPRAICAGRTDAGVHALGQVMHVDVPAHPSDGQPDLPRLTRSLRGLVPDDIAVRALAVAPEGFDARFSAVSRAYSYSIADARTLPDPLMRNRVFRQRLAVDVHAINEAALPLLGLHDFAAFCRARPRGTAIRTLLSLEAFRVADDLIRIEVEADAFCHTMVRSLVGALLPVGAGSRPVDWPAALLAARRRDPGLRTLPPHALVLERVRYPEPGRYEARARRTRAVRDDCPDGHSPPGDLL